MGQGPSFRPFGPSPFGPLPCQTWSRPSVAPGPSTGQHMHSGAQGMLPRGLPLSARDLQPVSPCGTQAPSHSASHSVASLRPVVSPAADDPNLLHTCSSRNTPASEQHHPVFCLPLSRPRPATHQLLHLMARRSALNTTSPATTAPLHATRMALFQLQLSCMPTIAATLPRTSRLTLLSCASYHSSFPMQGDAFTNLQLVSATTYST